MTNKHMIGDSTPIELPMKSHDKPANVEKIEQWLRSAAVCSSSSELSLSIDFMKTLKALPEIYDAADETETETSMSRNSSFGAFNPAEYVLTIPPIADDDPDPPPNNRRKPREPKRTAYIPAGHEFDLPSFHKYNG